MATEQKKRHHFSVRFDRNPFRGTVVLIRYEAGELYLQEQQFNGHMLILGRDELEQFGIQIENTEINEMYEVLFEENEEKNNEIELIQRIRPRHTEGR